MTGEGARVHEAAAVGFDRGAEVYERARPSYPVEAVDWLAERCELGPGARVVDLAAGTGKLTRLLVPTGAEVSAVEPVAGMRAQLAAAVPGVAVLDGTAESMPFEDGALDAVTVAQAFHWFDVPAALGEIARVLRSGGHLAVVFNVRDESVPWVAAFTDAIEAGSDGRPYSYGDLDGLEEQARSVGFGGIEVESFVNDQDVAVDDVVARAASTSFVAVLDDERRAAVLDSVAELLRTHPDTAGRERVVFPHTTVVTVATRT